MSMQITTGVTTADGDIIYTTTPFIEDWHSECRNQSTWHMLPESDHKIYLRYGFNLIGSSATNNIIIQNDNVQCCEIYIFVENPGASPIICAMDNNVILNEDRLRPAEPRVMNDADLVKIEVGNSLLFLEFQNDDE